jgi:hypothetical protein
MVCLGKHIKSGDGVKGVILFEEGAQVACEGGGVAGDVGDALWAEGDDAREGFGVGSSAWGVEEKEVDGR